MTKETPMMKQYKEIKAQYTDAFLFFRLGDFYELFFEDAINAARELEITLTKRGKGEDATPMCGVPHHSASNYISQLIEKGYKVAICEQTEDPAMVKGIVKREVVQLITPGTVMEGGALTEKQNNYFVSLTEADGQIVVVAVDMTTGEVRVTKVNETDALNEISSYRAREIVLASELSEAFLQQIKERVSATFSIEENETALEEAETVASSLQDDACKRGIYRAIHYVKRTTKRALDHLQEATYYEPRQFLLMDVHSKRNLELVETVREKKKAGSLLSVLDKTETSMGARLLKQWIERPAISVQEIKDRQELVSAFIDGFFERVEVRELLRGVYDLERLSGRISFGNVNGRDLLQLKNSLLQVPKIVENVRALNTSFGEKLVQSMEDMSPVVALLEESIKEDCPISITEGDLIKDGYNSTLDDYRHVMQNGKSWIAELEQKERQETGIKTLKVGFNKVFGYYIEVTKANVRLLPEGRYERKQTLTNAERYVTPELKEREVLILEAEEKSEKLEHTLFLEIREQVKSYIQQLQLVAKRISTIDCLQSFAEVAEQHNYVEPTFTEDRSLQLKESRHPVVEQVIDAGDYVANDIELRDDRQMLLITGPNMAGKSTYMRQVALTSIMAQIGSFVPATEARLPIFDQIFTRIGAADDLASGQSTFMVEMLETKQAVLHATDRSLLLLDEIGRGTSTYDGMALAQAIMEYIHDEIGAKTLFSTHYHELTALSETLPKLWNVHVSAKEENDSIVFLHKVVEGAADRSYGIYVAELAELPYGLITRAKSILQTLESERDREPQAEPEQLTLFALEDPMTKTKQEVLDEVSKANILTMTPLQVMELVDKWQRKLS
ncbi:DNA mismatch repair protein MutS [Paenalkalicoccus suaedae]|uniref:DNA mismatch repair protein MutS n=1 Tax=Paenalkalicoccus suaedae TaxID=2592382 RepID=A0A859FDS9_9BACI|nr:DNA mismatch repair protein MutS [Paenalkalicoccus suaedae]QKS71359.1 DNA mismatch repair protein MutS [Paenalkalicoccus suaedae]